MALNVRTSALGFDTRAGEYVKTAGAETRALFTHYTPAWKGGAVCLFPP